MALRQLLLLQAASLDLRLVYHYKGWNPEGRDSRSSSTCSHPLAGISLEELSDSLGLPSLAASSGALVSIEGWSMDWAAEDARPCLLDP